MLDQDRPDLIAWYEQSPEAQAARDDENMHKARATVALALGVDHKALTAGHNAFAEAYQRFTDGGRTKRLVGGIPFIPKR